jgi:hypothetical protein
MNSVAFCMINGTLKPAPFSAYSRSDRRQNTRSNLHLKYYFLTADASVSASLGAECPFVQFMTGRHDTSFASLGSLNESKPRR